MEHVLEKKQVHTQAAPAAVGVYSQAIQAGGWVFLSGQIPLDPATQQLVGPDFRAQAHQVFRNLAAVCQAAGCTLSDVVKLTVYLTDLSHYAVFNEVMAEWFQLPYPARAVVGVRQLPREAHVEAEAIVYKN